MTTVGMVPATFPIAPGIKYIMPNVTIVVSVLVNTGSHVSFTPPIIAASFSSPAFMRCWIASLITTALSTRIPRLIISAAIEIN